MVMNGEECNNKGENEQVQEKSQEMHRAKEETVGTEFEKRYELADQNVKILPSHRCVKCTAVLLDVYACMNVCKRYCKAHLPENNQCDECEEELILNESLSEVLKKKYEIRCLICKEEMMLSEFELHLQRDCKKSCPQECGGRYKEDEMEEHIKRDCINTMVGCIGCQEKLRREMIDQHQKKCQIAFKHFDLLNQVRQQHEEELNTIQNKNSTLKKENNSLKSENLRLLGLLKEKEKQILQLDKEYHLAKDKIRHFEEEHNRRKIELEEEKIMKEQQEKYLKKEEKRLKKEEEEKKIKGLENSILTVKEMEILKKFLDENDLISNFNYLPLYLASVHGFRAHDFHRRCDGKEKLLVLIKANNFVFGGYNPLSWNSRKGKKFFTIFFF